MAVRAAVVLSKQYTEQSAKTGRTHNLRIGVHLGDVAIDADGDLYGDGVNAAARIEAAVDPGQVVVSEDVWRLVRGREGFRFERLGNRNLKGVGLIEHYDVIWTKSTDETTQREQRKVKIRSIAVLPFADLSAKRDQEHLAMVSRRKSSMPSVRSAVCTFRRERPVSRFAEPHWTRARLASVLGSRHFSTVASEKLESASGSACNWLTRVTGISSGLNASIARLKTSSRFKTRLPEAFWNRWVWRSLNERNSVS